MSTDSKTSAADLARLLADVADADTVYRDVYVPRARALLSNELSAEQYRGFRGVHQQIDDAIAKSRAAAMLQDWKLVHELTDRAEQLRHGAEGKAALMTLGELVYDAPSVVVDPFSPGLGAFAKRATDLAELRDQTASKLARLVADDPERARFYEARRTFLGGLAVATRRPETQAQDAQAPRAVADLERLAYEAAQHGDVAELKRLASEILTQKAAAATTKKTAPAAGENEPAPVASADACPVDLGAPFPDGVEARAHTLGLAAARTEPLPKAAPLFDYVAARIGQVGLQTGESEHDGAMKIEALVDQGAWPADVSEHLKVLIGQFVRNAFVNSGGARFRPTFQAESVLIEDHPEDTAAPAESPLLATLRLATRRGLARVEIETALFEHGPGILADRLQLDPEEFRLVCIPQDLYSRFGRDRGWGAQQQWTHFDGYQLITGGRLRALVGGDVRYGGLNDLTSIAPTDKRESVVARFAVIRRARQVARWR